MAKATRKFTKTHRKTIVFRFRNNAVSVMDRDLILRVIREENPGAKIIGPYAECDTYHLWVPRPGRRGRPAITGAERSVLLNRDLFEVVT